MVRGIAVHLTPKEFELLRQLVADEGKPLTHRRLLQAIWGPDYGDETEYLRVTVNQLRKKIEPDPSRPKYILTEPWVGYRLVIPSRKGGENHSPGYLEFGIHAQRSQALMKPSTSSMSDGMRRVEIEVQLEDIDARFAEESQVTLL